MTHPVVEPGRTCLGNRYELGRLLAAGGMGQVWEGHDVLLGRPVAVKVLRSEYTGDPTFLARFRAEAQNAAALSHPHIAAVYDYGEVTAEDGSGETLAYLVMELVPGEPLSEALRRSGSLGTERTLTVLAQTAAGLAEAHRAGMVHRDVKPGNLMITPDGDVKITDFGIAWSARSVALTQTGQVIGTPQYLSPEQAEGKQATPASDVYALGLIGYECLTGQPAFDGDNAVTIALKQLREEPEPLPDDLPARVRTLVHRAMEKNPAARMPDGAAFLAAVDAVRAGRSIDPAPTTALAASAVPGPAVDGPAVAGPAAAGPAAAGAARSRRAAGAGRVSRPPDRRRTRAAVVLLPLLGLLAGAGIAAMLLQGLAGGTGTPAAEAGQQRGDAVVVLVEDDYLGRPADEVAVQLAALGLTVERELAQRTDAEPGTVVGVDPAGQALAPGDTVILQVAVAAGDDGSGGAGGGSAGAVVAPDSTPGAIGDPGAAGDDDSTGGAGPDDGEAPGTDAELPATDPGAGSEAPGTGEGTGADTGSGTGTGSGEGTGTGTDGGADEGSGTDEGTDGGTGGDTGGGTTTPPSDTSPAAPSTATSTSPASTTTG